MVRRINESVLPGWVAEEGGIVTVLTSYRLTVLFLSTIDGLWELVELDKNFSSIPLVIPSRYSYNPATNFIEEGPATDDPQKLIINDKALELIQSIKANEIAILSICGPYRSGKSYFLSQLLGGKDTFKNVASTFACTRGIWMATSYLTNKDMAILLIDTEGTDAPERESEVCTANLLTLTTLLSSYMIYNTQQVPRKSEISKLR